MENFTEEEQVIILEVVSMTLKNMDEFYYIASELDIENSVLDDLLGKIDNYLNN